MQEELRRVNAAMLAEVVASHVSHAGRRKAALERVRRIKGAKMPIAIAAPAEATPQQKVLTELTNRHKAAASGRDAALQRALLLQQKTKKSEKEVLSSPKEEPLPRAVEDTSKSSLSAAAAAPQKRKKAQTPTTTETVENLPWEKVPGEKLRVERRGCRTLPFVLERGDLLRWRTTVRQRSIGFALRRRAMVDGGAEETDVAPSVRLQRGRAYDGRYESEGPVTLVLVFDNSRNFFSGVDVACSALVERTNHNRAKDPKFQKVNDWQADYKREWTELHDHRRTTTFTHTETNDATTRRRRNN